MFFLYLKDSLLADEAFFVNSTFQTLNRLLYDEFVKSILKIVEKLDLTLEKQNIGEQEVRIFITILHHFYTIFFVGEYSGENSTFVENCRKLVSSALICVVDTFLLE